MDPYGNLIRQLMAAAATGQVSAGGYEYPDPRSEGPVSTDDAGLGFVEYFKPTSYAPPGELPYPESPYGQYDKHAAYIPPRGSEQPGSRARRHDAYFVE